MSGANGRTDPSAGSLANAEYPPIDAGLGNTPRVQQFGSERIKALVAELEVPFDPSIVVWRVTNTAKGEMRGQVVPYADPRAYTDRLNVMFTPAGWTRKYAVRTSANFERTRDKRIVAKVLVTCELTIFGLGSHSATGEDFADNENALTAAEAQAFKRAASCFGLGRYLYHFTGVWVDLDERKRPTSTPRLFGWATPQGWRQGLRPRQEEDRALSIPAAGENGVGAAAANGGRANPEELNALVGQIEAMAPALGRRLYRGVLKSVAKAWKPTEIHEVRVLRKVLEHMHASERGLRRLEAVLNKVGPGSLMPILRSLRLHSLGQVDSLDSLNRVVLEVERVAESTR